MEKEGWHDPTYHLYVKINDVGPYNKSYHHAVLIEDEKTANLVKDVISAIANIPDISTKIIVKLEKLSTYDMMIRYPISKEDDK